MAKAKTPLVVVTRKLPDSVETRMRELFDTRLNLDDKPMTQAELAEAAKTADVLVPTITDRIDATVLACRIGIRPERVGTQDRPADRPRPRGGSGNEHESGQDG